MNTWWLVLINRSSRLSATTALDVVEHNSGPHHRPKLALDLQRQRRTPHHEHLAADKALR
ncbi:hypothetical protein AB0I53_28380 [Saccharopolyspora sp. NPDC050389]|uniref:hypothetical protein n=1 Tax=Saccharopolyspora sp. NPDC050389 TaxID=3155516 RepID=UPI0033F934F6